MTAAGGPSPDVWYVAREGTQYGPFDSNQMQQQYLSGAVRPSDAVWRAGWPQWQAAGQVFQSLVVPPPPPVHAFASSDFASTAQPQPQASPQPQAQPQSRPETQESSASGSQTSGSLVDRVKIGSRLIGINRYTGVIVGSQRSSRTVVSGGGVNNDPITSQTFESHDVFIRLPDGSERTFDAAPAGIPLRTGSTVSFTLGIIGDQETGYYTSLWNHDTRQLGHLPKGIARLAGPPFYLLGYFVVGFAVFGGMLVAMSTENPLVLIGPILGGMVLFARIRQNRKALRAAMKKALLEAQ